MAPEVFSHSVSVETIDRGWAVGRLEPEVVIGPLRPPQPGAILALAQLSSQAAIKGVVGISSDVGWAAAESRLTHLSAPTGELSAAALIDCEHVDDVAADIHRTGNACARVNVAVVDDKGETIALGSFDYVFFNVAQPAS